MALKGRLSSATSKMTLSVRLFSGVLNVTEREMLPRGVMELRPTPENGREGESLDMGIYNFWKAVRLMRLRATLSSIKTWYSLTLAMVGETTSRSCPAPAMFLGQSKASNVIDVSIHLWWGAALGLVAAAATAQCSVLMTFLDVMSQELPYMTWSYLWCSLSLD
jgi:hypothetical protein